MSALEKILPIDRVDLESGFTLGGATVIGGRVFVTGY